MPNVDLTKQILVKVSDELDAAIEQACVEHRKRTGENISKPEKVREIIYSTLLIEQNMKEKFQKEAINARVAKLADRILSECAPEAKRGATSHSISMKTNDMLVLLMNGYYTSDMFREYGVYTPTRQVWKDIQKFAPFVEQIANELKLATGLNVKISNDEFYAFTVTLKISWND